MQSSQRYGKYAQYLRQSYIYSLPLYSQGIVHIVQQLVRLKHLANEFNNNEAWLVLDTWQQWTYGRLKNITAIEQHQLDIIDKLSA